MSVSVCSGCVRRASEKEPLPHYMDDFMKELDQLLQERLPDVEISLNSVGCQRFCPPNRLSLVVYHPQKTPAGRLTMTREATAEAAAQEIMNWFKT